MSGGNGSGEFVAGFLVGALTGAALALLFTPVTGEEMRSQLREKGIELKDRAEDLTLDAGKRADVIRVKGEALLGEQRGRFREAIEEGKRAAIRKKEELLTQLEDAKSSRGSADLTGQEA